MDVKVLGKLTKDQAEVALKWFATMRSEPDIQKIQEWWYTELPKVKSHEEFNIRYPVGSTGWYYFQTMYRYSEIMGELVYQGLVPVEFVLDALGGVGFNDTVKMILEGRRKEGPYNALVAENWEWLYKQILKYRDEAIKQPRRYK